MRSDIQAPQASRSPGRALTNIFRAREMSVLAALIVLVIIMSFASPYFTETQNIFNVLRNMSTISIVAIGMTMVIITGGIDLSVGSVLAVSAMLTARLMVQFGTNPWLALVRIWYF